jgi:hypothetical protein
MKFPITFPLPGFITFKNCGIIYLFILIIFGGVRVYGV